VWTSEDLRRMRCKAWKTQELEGGGSGRSEVGEVQDVGFPIKYIIE
jgi:hypothetical protein